MSVEIERKFLVTDASVIERAASAPKRLAQGYLSTGPTTVRVRTNGERSWLTIKGATRGLTRAEYEYEIPGEDAAEMLHTLTCGSVIEKDRYEIVERGHLWEVDVFRGENAPLVIAEVELAAEEEHVEVPDWVGEEVSADHRYTNANLALSPFASWGR